MSRIRCSARLSAKLLVSFLITLTALLVSATQAVAQSASYNWLVSGLNPSTYGQSVTFTDQVFSSGVAPTGTVTFKDGSTSLQTSAIATTTAANNSLTYSEVASSWSKTTGVTITNNVAAAPNGANTAAQIVYNGTGTAGNYRVVAGSTPNPISISGQLYTASIWVKSVTPITLKLSNHFGAASCNVTTVWTRCSASGTGDGVGNKQLQIWSAAGDNTGFTIFVWGAQYEIGSAPGAYVPTAGAGVANGTAFVATLSTAALAAGTHSLTAAYSGDANYLSSTSQVLTQIVNASASYSWLLSSVNPSTFGQSVTFTDQVFSSGPAPTGTVTLKDGSTSLGTPAVAGITTANNSLTYSEVATNWSKTTGVTITNNAAAAPNGANTAAQIVYDGTGTAGNYRVVASSTPNPISISGQVYTASIWVKSATPLTLKLSNHFVTANCNVTSVWTRCSASGIGEGVGNKQLQIWSAAGNNTSFTIFVWGAQYETGSAPGPYVATTGAGVTNATAYVATLSTAALAAATHSLTAAYSGDANYPASTSQALTQVVNPGASYNWLLSTLNPSTFGQSVTFTDQVFSSGPAPTGTVTFKDSSTSLGTSAVATTTTANNSLAYSELAANWSKTTGVTITNNAAAAPNGANTAAQIVYDGTGTAGNYRVVASSTPNPISISGQVYTASIWVKSATPLTLKLSNHFSSANCNVTSVWTRCSASGIGDGVGNKQLQIWSAAGSNTSFTIFVWGAQYETGSAPGPYVATTGAGVTNATAYLATLSTAALAAGTHTLNAAYGGDANYPASTSQAFTQIINKATPIVSVSCDATANYQQTVNCTPSITTGATGIATIKDGTAVLGTVAFNTALPISTLSAGSHSITATYAGDSNYAAAISAPFVVTIYQVTPSITVSCTPSSITFLQSVSCTATLQQGATGSVQFTAMGNNLGSAVQLSGTPPQAALNTTSLQVGTNNVYANYNGDANFYGASASAAVVVSKATPTVNLSCDPASVPFKTNITCTATLPSTATGSVVFNYDYPDGGQLGTGVVSSGSASASYNLLNAGSHSITAAYSGDSNFNAANSSAFALTVAKGTSTVTLNCSPNPSGNGQSVTCTAALPDNSVSANATIQFTDNGSNLGSPITPPNLTATYTTSGFSVGTHPLVAVYSGNVNYNSASSATVNQVVSSQTAPSISSLSVSSGVVGANVNINGSNFGSAPSVTFNGVSATINSFTSSQIRTSVPSGATTGSIIVMASGLTSNARNFTVLPTPTMTSATPLYGVVGFPVVISGTNFGNSQAANTISFNGTLAAASSWGPNRIVVPVPTGATTGTLNVQVSGVNFNLGTFKVQTPSTLSITPSALTLPLNSVQRFVALATYGDATTQNIAPAATWSSSNSAVLTVDSTGLFTAVGPGQAMVQAKYGAATSNLVTVNVGGPSFVTINPLHEARENHTATLLPDGTVLIAGGQGSPTGTSTPLLSSAELYDPTKTSFTVTGSMGLSREFHTATLLANGKVLITGGQTQGTAGFILTATAVLLDPSTGLFMPTGDMNRARASHSATLLTTGQVLIAGGLDENGQSTAAELYDPDSGTFTLTTGSMVNPGGGKGVPLNDGTVLFIEGASSTGVNLEIFNPATGTFTASNASGFSGDTAVLLSTGDVLNYGLHIFDGKTDFDLPSAQVYSATGKTFTAVGDLSWPRSASTGTRLSNGQIAVVGGRGEATGVTGYAEFYDPATQMFVGAGSLNTPRWSHTATLLNDGSLLVVGGDANGSATSSVELYQPSH